MFCGGAWRIWGLGQRIGSLGRWMWRPGIGAFPLPRTLARQNVSLSPRSVSSSAAPEPVALAPGSLSCPPPSPARLRPPPPLRFEPSESGARPGLASERGFPSREPGWLGSLGDSKILPPIPSGLVWAGLDWASLDGSGTLLRATSRYLTIPKISPLL